MRVTICIGSVEKAVMPFSASRARSIVVHPLEPAARSSTSNRISRRSKPSQADIPRKKTFLSGIRPHASTTLRSSSLKSDAFSRSMPESRRSIDEKAPACFAWREDPLPRLLFLASTTSAPSSQMRTISGISEGGCCRSPSITTTASPVACSRPAHRASSLPKWRLNLKARRSRAMLHRGAYHVPGVVTGTVIDEHDFVVAGPWIELSPDGLERGDEVLLFVEEGDDDRELHGRAGL